MFLIEELNWKQKKNVQQWGNEVLEDYLCFFYTVGEYIEP